MNKRIDNHIYIGYTCTIIFLKAFQNNLYISCQTKAFTLKVSVFFCLFETACKLQFVKREESDYEKENDKYNGNGGNDDRIAFRMWGFK